MFKLFKSKSKPNNKKGLTYMVDKKGIIILDRGGLSDYEVSLAIKKIKSSMKLKNI